MITMRSCLSVSFIKIWQVVSEKIETKGRRSNHKIMKKNQ